MAKDTEPSRNPGGPEDESKEKDSKDAARDDDKTGSGSGSGGGQDENDGFAMLRRDHEELRSLLEDCRKAGEGDAARMLERLAAQWARHSAAHRALHDCAEDAGLSEFAPLAEAAIETDLISFLLRCPAHDLPRAMQLGALRVADRMITAAIEREEKPRAGLLAKVKAAGVEADDLAEEIEDCLDDLPGGRGVRPELHHLKAGDEDHRFGGRSGRGMRDRDDDRQRRTGRGQDDPWRGRRDEDRFSRGRMSGGWRGEDEDHWRDSGAGRWREEPRGQRDMDTRREDWREDDRSFRRGGHPQDDDRWSGGWSGERDPRRSYGYGGYGPGHGGGWHGGPGESGARDRRRDTDDDRWSRDRPRWRDEDERGGRR